MTTAPHHLGRNTKCRLAEGIGAAVAAACRALQGLVLQLLPTECWESLPAATARACAPHWLAAAGWLAALMLDATAAAMGRLPAATRLEQARSHLDDAASRGRRARTAEVAANALCSTSQGHSAPALFYCCLPTLDAPCRWYRTGHRLRHSPRW